MNEQLRVLLATDDSVAARAAEPWLTNARWAHPPQVDVLTVAAPAIASVQWLKRVRTTDIRGAVGALERSEHARASELAEEIAKRLRAADLAASACARNGDPAVEILAHAAATQPDLIMLGPRGRSEFAAALLGSVSLQVLAHTDRPVMVARPGGMVAGGLPRTVVVMVDGTLGARSAIDWLARAGWLREGKGGIARPDRIARRVGH